jgi:hypothetical protein
MITVNDTISFTTYDEAIRYFKLNTVYIKIVDHPESFEEILQNGKIVKCIGIGRRYSPGKPGSNQQLDSQYPLLDQASNYPYLFPIFHEKKKIQFMGMYKLLYFYKKISDSGFIYFEYRFCRHSKDYISNNN